ncbi:MAG: GNAT family N-acetyltransferase [Streptosporangiaceae bacterium]
MAGTRRVSYARPMLHPDYPIETARLTLRPFSPDDLDDLYAYHSRPDVTRYLYWGPRDRAQVAEVLDRKTRQCVLEEEGHALSLVAVWREVGRVVGEVELHWLSGEHRQGEIGFVFNPDYHGRGLATEAAGIMLRLGFEDLGLHRIIGRCDAENHPSARLLERLGMRREAHFVHNEIFRGEWSEEFAYAMLEDEWKARRAAAS